MKPSHAPIKITKTKTGAPIARPLGSMPAFLLTSVICIAALSVQEADAKTIDIHIAADAGPGSLRQALTQVGNGDKINIDAKDGITLTSGELLINKNITIQGNGGHGTVSGNGTSRVFHISPGAVVTLDSLTITNGAANPDYTTYPASAGGGVYNDHAKLTVSNCVIADNFAVYGAGIFNDSTTSTGPAVTVKDSTLSNNSATFGAGIYNNGEFGAATMTLNNCKFSGNFAPNDFYGVPSGFGAGVFNDGFAGSAILTITNTQVTDGVAIYGGGIFNVGEGGGNSSLTVTNSVVANNYGVGGIGGGIYNDGEGGTATATLINSRVSGTSNGGGIDNDGQSGGNALLTLNNSSVSNNGGGIRNDGQSGNATLTVTNSTISGNGDSGIFNDGSSGSATATLSNSTISDNQAGVAAGIWNYGEGGGNAILRLSNCTVSNNTANQGGGIVNSGTGGSATVAIINSAISGNSAEDPGGGILNDGGTLTLDKSIVRDNKCRLGESSAGGGIYNSAGSFLDPASVTSATVTVSDSTMSGNSAGFSSAIYNQAHAGGTASVTLNNSTVSGNVITDPDPSPGAGSIYSIAIGGTVAVTVNNSTVSTNVHVGISNDAVPTPDDAASPGVATLSLNNSTITGNSGTAVLNRAYAGSTATVDVANTILNAGGSGETIRNFDNLSTVTSHGYNLSSNAAGGDGTTGPGGLLNGPGDIRNTNPLLGPLKNNGGPTMTHALLDKSPAINAGDPNFNPYLFNPPLLYDQRGPGNPRIFKSRIDIGAYEKH